MTTIYVRIPRNRWTPIGEIDLSGWQTIYHKRKGGPIWIDPEVLQAIGKATKLLRQIRAYQEKHHLTTRHERRLAKNRKLVVHLEELERKWREASANRIIEAKAKAQT